MTTEKMLVFLVLVASIPVAYTRHESLWNQLFPDDIIVPREQNNHAKRENVDIGGAKWISVDSKKEIQQEGDTQNTKIGLVDDNENTGNHERNAPDVPIMDFSKLQTNKVSAETDGTSHNVCRTVKCKELANEFLRSMNTSADPCENFHEFACGGYEASKPIPPHRVLWSHIYKAHDLTKYRVKEILEAEIKHSDILPVRQAKKWYKSCMNTERLERVGITPIEAIMMQVGGWPMAMNKDEWDENEISWKEVERHYARLTGSYAFHNIGVQPEMPPDVSLIYIDAPQLALAGTSAAALRNYNKNGQYDDYQLFVSRIAKTFAKHYKASVSDETLYRESEELVLFEREIFQLAHVNETEEYTDVESLSAMNDDDMGTDSESGSPEIIIDWSSEIEEVFNLAKIQVQPSTYVRITNAGYVDGLEELLQRTPKRTIVNYIHWHFLGKVLAFTNEELRSQVSVHKRMKDFFKLKESEPRWSECVDEMKMSHAAAFAFVKKYFPRKTKKAAKKIVDNIRIALERNIDNSNWLDAKTKTLSKKKLRKMKIFIGAPEWYSKSGITKYYEGLTIGADYLENNLKYMRYEVEQNLKEYVTPRPSIDPFMSENDLPTAANAFYIKSFNYAEFPAVDFESPFFGITWPNNVNYGKVGFLIGHEMGHAFDSCGIHYDRNGDKTEVDEMILRSFYESVDCFVNQFDKYDGIKKSVNGTDWKCDNQEENFKTKGQKTAKENMADTTGLQAVFSAYKRMNMKNNPNGDMRLPGLEGFTDDQMFFLSFGVTWCEARTPKFAAFKKKHSSDVHSGPEHRVNGAVSNTKEFSRAFKCPVGSPMNPTNKCSVWEKPGARINRAARNVNYYSWDQQWDD